MSDFNSFAKEFAFKTKKKPFSFFLRILGFVSVVVASMLNILVQADNSDETPELLGLHFASHAAIIFS